MTAIVEPTQAQLHDLVEPYLKVQPSGLGFAIGYASPNFQDYGSIYLAGSIQNQFGSPLVLNGDTPFEIASISKTFTATLYALLIRSQSPSYILGHFIYPNGPLQISSSLAGIPLDCLMNYTSGLPEDNDTGGPPSTPPYLPQPYSEQGMLSYLDAAPPSVSKPAQEYTYSNLAFAIMASILSSSNGTKQPRLHHFEKLVRENIFEPLGMQSAFFDKASLANLPLGYDYDYGNTPPYTTTAPGWPYFPAYFGAGGIVASPNDMWHWLLFNMGITQNSVLSPLLPFLQSASTEVIWGNNKLGLGWFIRMGESGWAPSIWKDGDLDGTNSYIAFLPSPNPGTIASQAGVFVLVNADGINNPQTNKGTEVVCAIANDLLFIMQGKKPPSDKSVYPRAALCGRRKKA